MLFNRRKVTDYTTLQAVPAQTTNGAARPGTERPGTERPGTERRFGASRRRPEANGVAAGQLAAESEPQREQLIFTGETLTLQIRGESALIEFPTATVTALRYMTTRLMVNQELPKRMAIVSALRGEGVTYSALATAALLANDTTRRICYVDLNWWWPSQLAWRTGVSEGGIVATIRQDTTVDQALIATNFNNLWLLPSGSLAPKQRAMMARSNELTLLLGRLSDQFDHLLLDIPAILTTSDAIPLASLADGCCVVVRQGVNTSSMVGKALKEIDHLAMLGVILNRAQHSTPAWLLKWIPQE